MGKRGPKPGEGGRPLYWTEARLKVLADDLLEWSKDSSSFHLDWFCAEYEKENLYPQLMSEMAKESKYFSESKKAAEARMRTNLSRFMYASQENATKFIFGLKNSGWTDKQQIEHSGEIETIHKYKIPEKKT